MIALRLIPLLLSALMLAAHFFRGGHLALVIAALAFPFLLLSRRPWARHAVRAALVLAACEWVRTLYGIARMRQSMGDSWTRMAAILAAVALFALLAAAVLPRRKPPANPPVNRPANPPGNHPANPPGNHPANPPGPPA